MRRRASSTPRWIASSSGLAGRISLVSHTTAGTPSTTVRTIAITRYPYIGVSEGVDGARMRGATVPRLLQVPVGESAKADQGQAKPEMPEEARGVYDQ